MINSRLVLILLAFVVGLQSEVQQSSSLARASESKPSGESYLSQTMRLFDTGLSAHETARSYTSPAAKEDPRTVRLLRDNINKATGE